MLGIIEIHAGDFKVGKNSQFVKDQFYLESNEQILREKIPVLSVKEVKEVSEDNIQSLSKTMGWGVAGSLLLGPVGLVAGLLAGFKSTKRITFMCLFDDGRKFLGTTDSKTWNAINIAITAFDF